MATSNTKTKYGIFAYFILIIGAILLWSIQDIDPDGTIEHRRAEMIGSFALITISYMVILTTRFKKLEDYFGGMDKLFKVHKILGVVAILLIITHNIIMPEHEDDTPGPAKIAGIISFLGFTIIVVLTIFSVILRKYEIWLTIHRLVGIFLITALAHSIIALKTIAGPPAPIILYLRIITIVAIIAFLYKVVFYKMLKKHYKFTVSKIQKLGDGNVLDITLKAQKENFDFTPGQYAYVSFKSEGIKKETHPFTISGPADNGFHLSIKAVGDYTKHLYENLKENAEATVDGPYGRFNYQTGTKKQVWIAGGIGITPFLSWARGFSAKNKHKIHLIHSVRDEKDALFKDELKDKTNNSFKFSLYESKEDGHLDIDKIKKLNVKIDGDTTVYLCGPKKMMNGLKKQLANKTDINKEQILFEGFSIK